MREKRTENLNVRISPSTRARLLDLTNEMEMSQSDVIEELVMEKTREFIGRQTETRYIVMQESKKNQDSWTKGMFMTLDRANEAAAELWKNLNAEDRKKVTVIVYSEEGYYQDGEWMSDEPLSDIPEGAMNTANPNQVRNIIEAHEGVADVEVYRWIGGDKPHFHTDGIESLEDFDLNTEALLYEIMDEKTYDSTILANSSVKADFTEWYDDDAAEVLCILIR